MLNHRVVVGLVGSWFLIGCGRLGFNDTPGADDDGSHIGDGPCTETATRISTNSTERAFGPQAVWNGSELGVAWIENPEPYSLHFRSVPLGSGADPLGHAVMNPGVVGNGNVDLGWDGTRWRLVWPGDSTGNVQVSTDGGAPRSLPVTGLDTPADVVAMSDGKIAYAYTTSPNYSTLKLTVLDANGTKLVNAVNIATGSGFLQTYSLLWTGSELAAFYAQAGKLMLLRLRPDGTAVAPAYTIGAMSDTLAFATAVWDGQRFLLGWHAANGFRGVYLGLDGAPLYPAIGAAGSQNWTFGVTPVIGAESDYFMWDNISGETWLQEMRHDGTIGDTRMLTGMQYPNMAWTGKRWVLVSSQYDPSTPQSPDPKPDFINVIQLCKPGV